MGLLIINILFHNNKEQPFLIVIMYIYFYLKYFSNFTTNSMNLFSNNKTKQRHFGWTISAAF